MFTSRAEYRILLRQDDADRRLTERGFEIGAVDLSRLQHWLSKKEDIDRIISFAQDFSVKKERINPHLEQLYTTPLERGCRLYTLLARPQLSLSNLAPAIPQLAGLINSLQNRREEILEAAEVMIKYEGYIRREKELADKMHRLEDIRIDGHFDYSTLLSLSTEARQKLERIRPVSIGQASRIPGVSPSDINVLLVLLGR
jgi:tRNA uridine 5-carboxymethylaminomethyl modification enzyme